jgi:hypothetical protein
LLLLLLLAIASEPYLDSIIEDSCEFYAVGLVVWHALLLGHQTLVPVPVLPLVEQIMPEHPEED